MHKNTKIPQTIRRKKHKNNTICHAVHACTTARYHSGARGADAAAEPKAGVGSEADFGAVADARSGTSSTGVDALGAMDADGIHNAS